MDRSRAAEAAAAVTPPTPAAVFHGGNAPPSWLPVAVEARLVGDGADLTAGDLAACDVAIVAAGALDAIAVTRRIRARDAALHIVIVALAAQRDALERALLFTPGIGEVWVIDDTELDDDVVRRAAAVTRARRGYRRTQAQLGALQPQLRAARPGPQVSDAYLAALLQVLPDPVLSIDSAGRVLSWSRAAEQRLTVGGGRVEGMDVVELLRPADEAAFRRLLEQGRHAAAHGEIEWRDRTGALRHADIVIAPVHAGGHDVRAVVLRDTTDQRAALAARGRFYASMSHEIRTPVNAILGYNDLLLAGVYGELNPEQTAGIERAQNAARHLRELVDDALDLSKIEAGKIVIEPEHVALAELVQDVVATIEPLAAERGVTIDRGAVAPLTLHTDPRRLRQILLNLLSNAVKFGHGRPIAVRAGLSEDARVFIEVQDRGRGIGPDEIDRVFEEFTQLDGAGGSGTGLGLAISRRLATALGGSIDVASTPGAGSTFTLTLPAA
jgi:PAS domain S-box-containing protein